MRFQKKFLQPDEVAEILLVTQRTVVRMIKEGYFPNMDVGKRPWLIPVDDVLALLWCIAHPKEKYSSVKY